MAWRVQWPKRNATNLKRFAIFNAEVGARQPIVRRRGNFASYLLLQLQPRSDVVCVDVGIQSIGQCESKPVDLSQIAIYCDDDRVNQYSLAGFLAPE
jgi:hypothetical protein